MLYADRIRRQIQVLGNVPEPSDDAITHSEKLYQHLKQQLFVKPLAYYQVMEQLLHEPGLGYYSAGAHKIGAAGDFITAPEISSLFGFAIAQQCGQVLQDTNGSILEFGAGLGTLARDILQQLEVDGCLPEKYFIVEISADLRERQESRLKAEIPHLFPLICWLEKLPEEGFKGIILANEVIDAMPVHLFDITENGFCELDVVLNDNEEFELKHSENSSRALSDWFDREEIKALELPEGYRSEVNLVMEGWIESLGQCLEQGLILLIDYGYPRKEYYLAERSQGTLNCHYRHQSHDQVLILAGLQDITAHVDFTAIAESSSNAGLSVSGYTNQASFLSGCGILQMAEQLADGDLNEQMRIAQQIRTLIMPEEMGEVFKVIALSKNLPTELASQLIGFSFSDLRHHL